MQVAGYLTNIPVIEQKTNKALMFCLFADMNYYDDEHLLRETRVPCVV